MLRPNVSILGFWALFALVGYQGRAHAQSMDYNSLESLFGEAITTSATGTPQKASDAPANMTIITADEIRQSGSRQIPQILSRVPGLDILQTGYNMFDVGVRGYQAPFQPRLLVLIDGRQVFLDDYSRTAWDNIPVNVDDIRQIEVVIGASSALFGSNAAGGVINIVTYSPLYDNNNVASLSFGTQNVITGDGTTTLKGDWGGTKFSVGGLDAHEFNTERYSLDETPPFKPNHLYSTNNTVLQINPDLQGFTEATYSQSQGNTADPFDGALVGGERVKTYSVRGGLNWQTPYGLITSNNYLNHSFIGLSEPTDGGSPYTFTTNEVVSQLTDQFKIHADHTFRLGLEYKYKSFKMSGAQILEGDNPSLDENNYAINGSWLWQISDKLSWTNAARYDHLDMAETGTLIAESINTPADYSHSINTLSVNSDVVYKATDRDSIRVGYGRGVQMPSLINSGYALLQQFGTLGVSQWEGNPRLKPTIVQDYGLDYTRQIPEIDSYLKLGTFYDFNQDIVSPLQQIGTITINSTSYPYGQSLNVGNSHAYGEEIQIKGQHPLGFRWDASYSFADVHDTAAVHSNVGYQGSAPQHHFRLLLGYTLGAWEFDASGQYLSSTDMLRSTNGGVNEAAIPVGGYTTLSGRVGYNLNENYTLSVSAFNLNHHNLDANPYPALQREALMQLTGKF